MATLYVRESSGFREARPADIIASAQSVIARRYRTGTPVMESPARTREYLRLHIGGLEHEVFGCLLLDNRHRLIAVVNLFRGTIDGAAVHPREVVRAVIEHSASACIFFHNHPSGVAEASHADRTITQRLQQALQLIDVRVLDHLIVAETTLSFAEQGLL